MQPMINEGTPQPDHFYDGTRWSTWPDNATVYKHDPFEIGLFCWERAPFHGYATSMKCTKRRYAVIVSGHNRDFFVVAYWCNRKTTQLEAMLRRVAAMSDTSSLIYASGMRSLKRAEGALRKAKAECRFACAPVPTEGAGEAEAPPGE